MCPDACKEMGKEYRARLEAETKVRKTGDKIRSTYVSFASKEKKRLEELVAKASRDVTIQEQEVARLKGLLFYDYGGAAVADENTDILERAESMSAVELEKKKESRKYSRRHILYAY